jgi:glucokinase
MSAESVIGVDLGGTKILAGIVARDGTTGRTIEVPTPDDGDAILSEIDRVIDELCAEQVRAIGIGVPMPVDALTGIAFAAANLPLGEVDIPGRLRARFGLPVGIENDANAAALAEWRLGAGVGTRDLVVFTLGTGVGGGLVVGGRLFRGWAELGHIVIEPDGPPCQGSCHGHGHLEALASGIAADRAARELWGDTADARDLVRRAYDGDGQAVSALERIGRYLGLAAGSLVNIFTPEKIVVGGGFGAAAGEILLRAMRAAATGEAMAGAADELAIVPAAFGEEAGLVGAALVGFEALDGER